MSLPSFRSTLLQSELTVLAHHNSIVSNHNISHIRFLLFGSLSFSFWLLSAFFRCFICIYHAHVTFSFFFTWFISRKWPYIWTTKYTFTSFLFLFISQCLFLVVFLLGANWSQSLLLCCASLSLLFFSLRFHEIFSYSQLYTWIFWSFTASARTNIIASS